jgi:hypothetical protein
MEGQEQYEDNGLPGPGAPTPLSALDVSGGLKNDAEHGIAMLMLL